MRPIEFRAFDKERKEWAYFTLLQLQQGQASKLWTKLDKWCQFTGLFDKNGKKIFEGDVVVWKQALGGILQPDSEEKKCFIEWDSFFSAWKCRDIRFGNDRPGYTFHGCHIEKVIGNIFENKELL